MERNAKLATAVALFMAVASALVAIPMMDDAYAETTEPVEIGGEALLGQTVDGTVVLENDIALTSALIVTGELIIDLNGHGIVNSDANANHTIEVSETGDLTIRDSVGTGSVDNVTHAKAVIYNKGNTVIEGGEFVRSNETAQPADSHNSWYTIQNHGVMTIDGGTFVGGVEGRMGNVSSVIINGLEDAPEGETAELIINDATVIGANGTLKNEANGTLDVNGGTFVMDNTETRWYGANNMLLNYGVAQVSGATFTALGSGISSDSSEGFFRSCVFNAGEIVIDDVTFTMSGNNNRMFNVPDFAGSLTINGGTFTVGDDMEQGFEPSYLMHIRAGVDQMAVTINAGLFMGDFFVDGTSVDQLTVNGGYFLEDVADYVPETRTVYDFQGVSIVSEPVSEPVIVIDDVPFASMGDVADLVNATGGSMDADGDTLVLLDDFQVGGAKVTIPAGSEITIDLNGNDIVFDLVDVAGKLTLTDDSQVPGTVTTAGFSVIGGTLAGDAVVTSATADSIVQIVGSGTVQGITIDMSDVEGGAVEVYSGATGAVVVSGLTITVDDDTATVDRGVYINETAQGGSVTVSGIVFDLNGDDACPVNIDIDSNSHVTVSDLTYIDCARPNKVLVNATSDVTIGSEGNIDISDASDVVLWDKSDSHVFTVAGEYVVNGFTTITSGGDVVVPEGAVMIVNDSIGVASGSTLEGTVHFGSDARDSITLNDVVIGDGGLRLGLGSVTFSGSVASGDISVSGNGVVDRDLDLGASKLSVPEGSQLTVMRNVQLSGTEPVGVAGKVVVYGTVSAPVANDGEVYTIIGVGQVTGEVTGAEPVEKRDEPLSIEFIPDMTWKVGETYRLSLGIHPVDAGITGIHLTNGDDISWLTFDGHVLIGQPVEAGTYDIELTIGLNVDGEIQSEKSDFTITVVSEPAEEPDDDSGDDTIDWRYVVIGVVLIIMVIVLILRFL